MSEKNLDAQGRMRSKTVAFRMSPGEAELLQRFADVSGMTKQDYVISRVLQREVTVVPNKRMQLYMEEGIAYVVKELRRIEKGGSIPDDLAELIAMLVAIFADLGNETAAEKAVSDDDLIFGLER